MLYNVAQLLKAGVGTDLRQPIEGTIDLESTEVESIAPIDGEVRFQRTNVGILATGAFESRVRMQCIRCLEPVDEDITVSFDEMYLPTIEVNTGRPMPPITEELGFAIDARHHLDLAEMIRQQVILALPMQPLCREDCAGICPICGGNRNFNPCNCEAEADARWVELARLSLDDLDPTE